MTKFTLTTLFALAFFTAQAQTIEYSIYAPSKDSFFLVETVTGVATRDVPKPAKSEASQLFRSEEQLLNYITYLRTQAAQAVIDAEKSVKDAEKSVKDAQEKAKQSKEAAPRLESAATKIEAVAKANRDVLQGKKPETVPEQKPKKKGKKTKA